MLNAALIGLGWWGKNHLAAAHSQGSKLRFVHGVSKELDAALPLAEKYGFTLTDDLERALADPRVQAVVLATPHSLHTDQIVRVAQAGKSVFCEKPFALKRADAERSVAACARAGIALGVGTNKRFSAWRDSPEESPGGGMTGTGIHLLDAFVSLAGPVAEVNARLTTHRPGADPRDALGVNFEFASGL